MKNYLALFDLDGTLFDTNRVNYCAYKDALKAYGYELEYEYFANCCAGRYYQDFLMAIMRDAKHLEEVHELKKKLYAVHLDKARENIHLFNMIQLMKETYHIAIVTTGSRANCMEILAHFGYTELFERIISHEDVEKTKPDPEGYLRAMEYFRVSKENTIIFEDSTVGITAAAASGATVMKVEKF